MKAQSAPNERRCHFGVIAHILTDLEGENGTCEIENKLWSKVKQSQTKPGNWAMVAHENKSGKIIDSGREYVLHVMRGQCQ